MKDFNFMNYDHIIQKAIEFATKAHAGQKRKDGKDYITHSIAVLEILKEELEERTNETRINIALAALFHDIAEDSGYYKNKEDLVVSEFLEFIGGIGFFDVKRLTYTLKTLNKNNYGDYLEYILAVRRNLCATYVKRGDLIHNMSDLKEGALKDKYRLAEYILTN